MKQRAKTTERFDTSQLTGQNRGNNVHRDYLAHVFRWGWASRWTGGKRVLDVGCGRDTPLARTINYPMGAVPKAYVGVDYQKVDKAPGFAWCEVIGEFDFSSRWREICDTGERFDLVVSFESIEHMSRADGLNLLEGMRALCVGKLLLSTPCFNGRAAAAHVHEWRVDELRDALVEKGFRVVDRFGTFASYPDVKKALAADGERGRVLGEALERAREFYGDDVLACYLAPLYPDRARNNVWVCE